VTSPDRLTDQQLADIDARQQAATAGPWGVYESGSMIDVAADLEETGCGYRARRGIARFEDEPLDNDPTHREWTAEEDWAQVQADAEFVAHARQDVPALLAEVRALRSERDELRGKFADAAASLAEQVLRYGQRQREHNADREELEQLRTALTQIRHLHKDSPMSPCPVCVDGDAMGRGEDYTVPYPCPTARLAGAVDCDPPHVRADLPAVPSV
jgi:hypothetical protein